VVLGIEFIDYRTEERRALGIEKDVFVRYFDEKLDLKKDIVLPIFIDAHSHIVNHAVRANWVDLSNVKSKEALFSLIQEVLGIKSIFLGQNFDESRWPEREYPTRQELDKVSRDKPIFLLRIDGHMAIVNTCLIEELGLPRGIFKDFEKGIVVEDNVYLIVQSMIEKYKLKPSISALNDLLLLGIGAAADMGSILPPSARLRERLRQCVETYFYYYIENLEKLLSEGLDKIMSKYGGIITGLKIIVDGSIGARTAYLFEPYKDDPSNRGLLLVSEEHLGELIKLADKLRIQLAIHAIGDAAIDIVINAYKHTDPGLRHRIEHLEIPHEDHIEKLAKYNIVPSMQPNFIANWQQRGGLYEHRLGWERAERMNPLKTILTKRGLIAFGSDNMPPGPLYGIYGAMMHPREDERLSFYEAVECYTHFAAYSMFIENKLGRLEEGYTASFLVLEKVDTKKPKEVREAKILKIFVNGKEVTGG